MATGKRVIRNFPVTHCLGKRWPRAIRESINILERWSHSCCLKVFTRALVVQGVGELLQSGTSLELISRSSGTMFWFVAFARDIGVTVQENYGSDYARHSRNVCVLRAQEGNEAHCHSVGLED